MDTLEELKYAIDNFANERDWSQFHSPANLAKSISIEANELLECFQWDDNNYSIEDVKEELADVINYSIRMASVLDINIKDIVIEKMKKNAIKYPIDRSRGRSEKYTAYAISNSGVNLK